MFRFEKKNKHRIGSIQTDHGKIKTPAFLPDATYGSVRTLTFKDVFDCNINQVLCTTLHLYIRPGDEYIKKNNGLHNFIGWDKPILTDSGGWQVFSLIHQSKKGRVTEKGAFFHLPTDGSKHFLSPEKSIQIQLNLGSDIVLVLDNPILGTSSYEKNKKAVELTTIWAKKAKNEFLKQLNYTIDQFNQPDKYSRPLLFAIVQGGNYKHLREKSASELLEIGFDGYGYGGILIKEDRDLKFEMLKLFADLIPKDKIRYGMGVGRLEDIKFCVENGYDLFDSVVPTRNARHGTCYTSDGKISLPKADFKNDFSSIDENCSCKVCSNKKITRAYLHHLFKVKEMSAMRMCSIHNLSYYADFMNQFKVQ